MAANAIDPAEFRGAQKQSWNIGASGWIKNSEFIDSSVGNISDRLVELAGVQPGSQVIDIACGYGEPTLTAAKVAGPEGRVVATDISPEMLGYARERIAAAGIDNVEFVESDANSLDFPADSFDAAVSRWGIIFDPDGEGAAAKVRSCMQSGSKFAISSWGKPEEVPFLSVPMGTTLKFLGLDPPPPGTPGPLSRPTPEALGSILEGGGFSDVQVEQAEVTFDVDSPEEFTRFTKEIAAPIRAMIDQQEPDVQEQAWQAITDATREHASEDGSVSFTNVVLLASGSA